MARALDPLLTRTLATRVLSPTTRNYDSAASRAMRPCSGRRRLNLLARGAEDSQFRTVGRHDVNLFIVRTRYPILYTCRVHAARLRGQTGQACARATPRALTTYLVIAKSRKYCLLPITALHKFGMNTLRWRSDIPKTSFSRCRTHPRAAKECSCVGNAWVSGRALPGVQGKWNR